MLNTLLSPYLVAAVLCAITSFTQGTNTIFDAVKNRDIAKVRAIVEANPSSITLKDDGGWTPLHYAAGVGDIDIVGLLIAKGANINARSKDEAGLTPLMMAAFTGKRAAAELLIYKGADVDATTLDNGATALGIADQQGHKDVVELLETKATSITYQAQLKNAHQILSFDAQGRQQVSRFSIASGSTIQSACGKGTFVQARVESAHVVDGKAVLRIPPGEMVYTTKGSVVSFLKMRREGEFMLVGAGEDQFNRSTAELKMNGKCAIVTGLPGAKGGAAGFYIVVDIDRGSFDVEAGLALGGRFRFRNE